MFGNHWNNATFNFGNANFSKNRQNAEDGIDAQNIASSHNVYNNNNNNGKPNPTESPTHSNQNSSHPEDNQPPQHRQNNNNNSPQSIQNQQNQQIESQEGEGNHHHQYHEQKSSTNTSNVINANYPSNNNHNQINEANNNNNKHNGNNNQLMNIKQTNFRPFVEEIYWSFQFYQMVLVAQYGVVVLCIFYDKNKEPGRHLRGTIDIVGMKKRGICILAVEMGNARELIDRFNICITPMIGMMDENGNTMKRLDGTDWCGTNYSADELEEKLMQQGMFDFGSNTYNLSISTTQNQESNSFQWNYENNNDTTYGGDIGDDDDDDDDDNDDDMIDID